MRTSPIRSATGMISFAWAIPAIMTMDAHQTFIKSDLAALHLDYRLVGERNASLIERSDDFVGSAYALPAECVAFDVGQIGDKRTVTFCARCMQGVLRAGEDFRRCARVARRDNAPDRYRYGHRAGHGEEWFVTYARKQPLGRD